MKTCYSCIYGRRLLLGHFFNHRDTQTSHVEFIFNKKKFCWNINTHNYVVTTGPRWLCWAAFPSRPRQMVHVLPAPLPPRLPSCSGIIPATVRLHQPHAVSPFQLTTHRDEICWSASATPPALKAKRWTPGPGESQEQIVALLATCCMCCSKRKMQQATADVCDPRVLPLPSLPPPSLSGSVGFSPQTQDDTRLEDDEGQKRNFEF